MGILDNLKEFFTIENTALIVAAICGVVIVVAWILLIMSATKLNYAKAYGVRKRETCGNEYLESETARYELDKAYNSSVDKLMHISNMMLFTVTLVPILISVLITVFSASQLKSAKSEKGIKIGIFVFAGVLVLAMLGVYLTFWIKELMPSTQSKYLTMYNLQSPPVSRKVRIVTMTISIILVLWISVIAYKHIGATIDETTSITTWPKSTESNQQLAILFSVVTAACSAILFVMDGDRPLLQQNIIGKYGVVKSNLQTSAFTLSTNPDFKRYLEINIKRANPQMDGIPDLTDALIKDQLYAYLEHRPGVDRFDVGDEYITVWTLKDTFNSSINAATTVTDRHTLLELLQKMYATEVDAMFIFTLADIGTWLQTVHLFQANTALATAIMAHLTTSIGIASNVTYENLKKILDAFTYVPTDDVSADADNVAKLKYLLYWFVHFSNYKDETKISYETIGYYLGNGAPLPDETITTLKANFVKLQNTKDSTGITTLASQMRAARASEAEIIAATDAFLKHVFWITICIIAVCVYLGLHFMYIKNKALLVSILTIMILFGIFIITWYAWFFAKLKL